jgi:hypothetical protein
MSDYCDKNPDGVDVEYSQSPHCVHTVRDAAGGWVDLCCWCGDVFESLGTGKHGAFLPGLKPKTTKRKKRTCPDCVGIGQGQYAATCRRCRGTKVPA